jgi:superfamily I DNA/RNA helicase
VIYGVKDWMMKQADKSEKGLIEAVAKMLVNTPGKPLHERVQHIKRLNMAKKTTSQDSGVLTLSTIHAAKGLEWERVWIPFCNQDMLPNKKANLSEERRLMFVAMTRAIRQLVISANHYKKSEFFTQLVGHISVEKVPDKNFMSSTVLD